MPLTFLAHQAPVLPLKLLRPRWWSGTALVLGSMAPDLEYLVQDLPHQAFAHSIAGQLLVCLPLTVALTWLVRRVLAGPTAAHLPDCGVFHLRDYGALARGQETWGYWAKVVPSALVGSFSHMALDGLTHGEGWAVSAWPLLRSQRYLLGFTVPVYAFLQVGLTVAGISATLALLHRLGSRRAVLAWAAEAPLGPEHGRETRAFWAPVLFGAVAGVVWGFVGLDLSDAELCLRTFFRGFFRVVALASCGLVLTCVGRRGGA